MEIGPHEHYPEAQSWTRWIPWAIAGVEFLIILFLVFNSYGKGQTTVVSGTPNEVSSESSSPEVDTSTNSSETKAKESTTSAEPNRETRFKVGDSVRVSVNTNLRSTASTQGEVIQTLSAEEVLEIIEGPTAADEYWWWKVKITSTTEEKKGALVGLKGYVSEGYWLESTPSSSSAATSSPTTQ
jgi:hypothetical protein